MAFDSTEEILESLIFGKARWMQHLQTLDSSQDNVEHSRSAYVCKLA